MLTASHSCNDFATGAVLGLVPYFVTDRHYSYSAATGFLLAATLFSAVMQPLFGSLSDRYRMNWMVGTGMTLSGLGVGVSGLTHEYFLTCACIGASGIGSAAFHPEGTRMTRDYGGSSSRTMSLFLVGGSIGSALGPLGVAGAFDLFGLRGTPFLASPAIVMAIIYSVVRFRVRPSTAAFEQQKDNERSARLEPAVLDPSPAEGAPAGSARRRSFQLLILVIIASAVGTTSVRAFIALLVIHRFHQPTSIGALMLTLTSVGAMIGTVAGGVLADRFGRRRVVYLSYVLAALMLVGIILVHNFGVVVALIVALGVTSFGPFSAQVALGQEILSHRVGAASGLMLGAGQTAGGAASPLLGFVADSSSLDVALWVGVAMLLVAVLATLFVREPRTTHERVGAPLSTVVAGGE